jgi:hypothetical protein
MTDPTTPPEESSEESGAPIGITEEAPVRPPIILTPPPLLLDQAQKIADAIKAVEDAIDALGTVGGLFAKWALGKVMEGLRAMGPIPPLGPPLGTQEPSTPPPTTP